MTPRCPCCGRIPRFITTSRDRADTWDEGAYCQDGDRYYKHGTALPFTPDSEAYNPSLSDQGVREARDRYEHESASAIADDLGVSLSHVREIANGEARTEVPA